MLLDRRGGKLWFPMVVVGAKQLSPFLPKQTRTTKNLLQFRHHHHQYRSQTTAATTSTTFDKQDINDCNAQYRGILRIQRANLLLRRGGGGGSGGEESGYGLVAQKDFQKGELVMVAKAVEISTKRHSHTIQKGWDEHVVMDLPAILINHSCEANVGIRDNDDDNNGKHEEEGKKEKGKGVVVGGVGVGGAYNFYALQKIPSGDELTLDYETTEYELDASFECLCGSPNCRKSIVGFKENGELIKQQYGPYYANYLKEETSPS